MGTLPLARAPRAMSDLVSSRGRSLLYLEAERAGVLSAAILKDGVVVTYMLFGSEADYTVALQHPKHPRVKLHDHSTATISKILEEHNLPWNALTCSLAAIDEKFGKINQQLTDEVIFRRYG